MESKQAEYPLLGTPARTYVVGFDLWFQPKRTDGRLQVDFRATRGTVGEMIGLSAMMKEFTGPI